MEAIRTRTPVWLMVAMVALLALAIVVASNALDADAAKKGLKTRTVQNSVTLPDSGVAVSTTAICPAGFKATGGGIRVNPNEDFVEGSEPAGKNGWKATGFRAISATGSSTLTAIVICGKV
jgi:hypothetical protein